jgi:hypothetical protein
MNSEEPRKPQHKKFGTDLDSSFFPYGFRVIPLLAPFYFPVILRPPG